MFWPEAFARNVLGGFLARERAPFHDLTPNALRRACGLITLADVPSRELERFRVEAYNQGVAVGREIQAFRNWGESGHRP